MAAISEGQKAPDIRLPLLGGGEFSLEQSLSSGPVVLAFFKVSCPICQYAFPYLQRLSASLESRGVQVIGVSQDDESATTQFARTCGITFPIALEETKRFAVSNAYGLTNVPTVFEVSPTGYIEMSSVGWSRAEIEAIYSHHVPGDVSAPPLFQPGEDVADFRAG